MNCGITNNNKIKFAKNTEFWLKVILEKGVDEFGRNFVRTGWIKYDKDLDLGSIKNPQHQEVIGMKWVNKNNEDLGINFKQFFDGLMGGGF